MSEVFLGMDVGSVTTKFAAVDRRGELVASLYRRTGGQPIQAIREGLAQMAERLPAGVRVLGMGATGSGRQLAGAIVGADVVKNEITAHAVAALHFVPAVRTVIDIGGQDSKLILLRDGIVVDFAMNSVCAAGTGSFLEQQAHRLGITVEELGQRALLSEHPVRIAGRCTVFAESDMVHKQQMGHPVDDIIYDLSGTGAQLFEQPGAGQDARAAGSVSGRGGGQCRGSAGLSGSTGHRSDRAAASRGDGRAGCGSAGPGAE